MNFTTVNWLEEEEWRPELAMMEEWSKGWVICWTGDNIQQTSTMNISYKCVLVQSYDKFFYCHCQCGNCLRLVVVCFVVGSSVG